MGIRQANTAIRPEEFFRDPKYYVFDTLPKQHLTRFLVVNEAEIAAAPFIDIRFDNASREDVYCNTRQLLKISKKRNLLTASPNFIFHHSFVCSTLLARCMNEIDAFFALKEPWIMRRMADLKRCSTTTAGRRDWAKHGKMYMQLLVKSYASGDAIVIKPTNLAINLIVDVCRWFPKLRIVFLYSDLESFLVSNLKKTDETKAKVPSLLQSFLMDSNFGAKTDVTNAASNLSFLQSCAAIWMANVYSLKEQSGHVPAGALRTLDMDSLLRTTDVALTVVSQHFGHTPTREELGRMTHQRIMGRHAKSPDNLAYSLEIRDREFATFREMSGQEIQTVLRWAEPAIRQFGLRKFLHSSDLMN